MDGYHDNLEKLQAALFAYRRWKRAWFGIHKWWIAAGVKKDKYIFRVLLEHFEAESMPG